MRAVARLAAAALTLLTAAVVLFVPRCARADETALAEALFQQGLAAMQREDLPRACALLAESQRLDPAGGTLLNLALCHERAGMIATAWARYHDALGVSRREGRADRTSFAEEHIETLEPRVPHVAITMSEPLEAARVTVDGIDVGIAVLHAPIPIDPGTHDLRVAAPRRRPYLTTFVVAAGEVARISVPALAPDPLAEIPSSEKTTARGGTRRVIGWSLVGAGGSGVLASAVLGALAIGAESTADAACPGDGACSSARGLDASNRATTFATAATVSGAVGIAVLAGGIALLLTAPSGASASR